MSISRIKNRISEAATEACGYSPLTKVVSEEEINRILEQESGLIMANGYKDIYMVSGREDISYGE